MNYFEILEKKFPEIEIQEDKVVVKDNFFEVIKFAKTAPELSFDMLFSIIAVDYINHIELIYILYSTYFNCYLKISNKVIESTVSVTSLFNSAFFDECEIYDLFGIDFIGNSNIYRLFMPNDWKGHPLRKNYKIDDRGLCINE